MDISEDVLELSSRLGVTFSHVKRSANAVVGGLDRKEWGKRLWFWDFLSFGFDLCAWGYFVSFPFVLFGFLL